MHIPEIGRLPRWLFLLTAVILLVAASGSIIHLIEPETFPTVTDGFWWVFITISTVGYGDLVPSSAPGRMLAVFTMLIGAGLISAYFFTAASFMLNRQTKVESGSLKTNCTNHTIIIGWNARSYYLIDQLGNQPIVLIDFSLSVHPLLHLSHVRFIHGVPHSPGVLERAGMPFAKSVVITADQHLNEEAADAQTILTILSAKRMNPSALCIAELVSGHLSDHALTAGADKLIESKQVLGNALVMEVRDH
ncbi:potassium channel family protein [Jeotgalibacillus sp. R-1-5s-1]|uniref:potassium channel family protein n=1 Tax=Jeotgalibacillus sp. R-1-5s-1 TaxID=2555897 RepID=UPI00141B67D3|nr:potassium channel family protein [Jeotgalibacillus sp. R-1-5s-1]